MLKDVPANMPKSLQELRIHENEITKIKKSSFQGMSHVIVMGMETKNTDIYFKQFEVVWQWMQHIFQHVGHIVWGMSVTLP